MPSEARQKKIMEKLNRAQKCSILGPQNLGSRGGARAPGPPPLDPHLTWQNHVGAVKMLIGCRLRDDLKVLWFWNTTMIWFEVENINAQNQSQTINCHCRFKSEKSPLVSSQYNFLLCPAAYQTLAQERRRCSGLFTLTIPIPTPSIVHTNRFWFRKPDVAVSMLEQLSVSCIIQFKIVIFQKKTKRNTPCSCIRRYNMNEIWGTIWLAVWNPLPNYVADGRAGTATFSSTRV